jgi:hypothetical protein
MKHLYRYIKGTVDYGILFQGDPRDHSPRYGLYAASDAAHADNADRVSTGGYVVFVGRGPAMWKSKKQPFVTLSTAEAEFINLTPTGQALIWFGRLLTQLASQYAPPRPLILLTDSQNARAQTLNPLCTARTRHLDLRYKWIIEKTAEDGAFDLQYIGTDDMPADGLTKPL